MVVVLPIRQSVMSEATCSAKFDLKETMMNRQLN